MFFFHTFFSSYFLCSILEIQSRLILLVGWLVDSNIRSFVRIHNEFQLCETKVNQIYCMDTKSFKSFIIIIVSFTFILYTMPLKKISIFSDGMLSVFYALCVKCERFFTVFYFFIFFHFFFLL